MVQKLAMVRTRIKGKIKYTDFYQQVLFDWIRSLRVPFFIFNPYLRSKTMAIASIPWENLTENDVDQIARIVARYGKTYPAIYHDDEALSIRMDIAAAHLSQSLDLEKLLQVEEFTFFHDINGIRSHLNRETGQLEQNFLPRCSKKGSYEKED
jgi:hypothetical protein